MQIGSDESFLLVERVGQQGPTVVWRIQAGVAGVGCLAAMYRRASFPQGDDTLRRVAEFVAYRVQRFKLNLSRGDWLRIGRSRGGSTLVSYRLGHLSAGATLEGRIRLNSKSAAAFCRQLGELL